MIYFRNSCMLHQKPEMTKAVSLDLLWEAKEVWQQVNAEETSKKKTWIRTSNKRSRLIRKAIMCRPQFIETDSIHSPSRKNRIIWLFQDTKIQVILEVKLAETTPKIMLSTTNPPVLPKGIIVFRYLLPKLSNQRVHMQFWDKMSLLRNRHYPAEMSLIKFLKT